MDAITANGKEITFKPAPEFTYITNLIASDGKVIKVAAPTQYESGFRFYKPGVVGGGQFTEEERETIEAATAILNERWQQEQAERERQRAKRAAEILRAKEDKLAGMDNVQLFD